MSDHYLALVDPTADAKNSHMRAERLRNAFVAEGIILAETSVECVLGGIGYLPGPRLKNSYDYAEERADRPAELHYWDMLDVCGVEIHAEKWVNMYGFLLFEWARCPNCQKTFDRGSEIMNPLMDAVGEFIEEEQPSNLQCPACAAKHGIQSWTTKPHLGFCHLAAVFWNWPDFEAKGWRISVPDIAARAIGSQLVTTYGRV